MAIHPIKEKTLVTASIAVFLFALAVAWKSSAKQQEVLGVTAAYAAVTVVFVGISGPREVDSSLQEERIPGCRSRSAYFVRFWQMRYPRSQTYKGWVVQYFLLVVRTWHSCVGI